MIQLVKTFLKIDGIFREEYSKYLVGTSLSYIAFYVVKTYQEDEEFAISILDSNEKTVMAGLVEEEHPVHFISRLFSEKDKQLLILGESLDLIKEMHKNGFDFSGFIDSQEDWIDEVYDGYEVDFESGDQKVRVDSYKKLHNKAIDGLHFTKFLGWRCESSYSDLNVDCDDNGKPSYSWGPFLAA